MVGSLKRTAIDRARAAAIAERIAAELQNEMPKPDGPPHTLHALSTVIAMIYAAEVERENSAFIRSRVRIAIDLLGRNAFTQFLEMLSK